MPYMTGQVVRFTRYGWNPDTVKTGVVAMWFGGDTGVFDVMCEGYRMTLDNWDHHELARKEDFEKPENDLMKMEPA
jgi:hypothetical protein